MPVSNRASCCVGRVFEAHRLQNDLLRHPYAISQSLRTFRNIIPLRIACNGWIGVSFPETTGLPTSFLLETMSCWF